MALIPQVKCPRCDRKYSALRGRCPYCGARRHSKAKRTGDTDNATWKLIIGIVLMVVLIAAVVVLLVTSMTGEDKTPPKDNDVQPTTPGEGLDDGVTSVTDPDDDTEPDDTEPDDGASVTDPDTTTPDDTGSDTTPTPSVQSAKLMTPWGTELTYNSDVGMYDFTLKPTEELQLSVKTVPENTGATPIWTSSDENVLIVLQSGKVTGIASGTATLTVEIGGLTLQATVRVRG